MIALAYASGVIVFSRTHKPGTLPVASAPAARLRKVVSGLARTAYDGKTPIVPGLPEANSWDQRAEALARFTAAVNKRLFASTPEAARAWRGASVALEPVDGEPKWHARRAA